MFEPDQELQYPKFPPSLLHEGIFVDYLTKILRQPAVVQSITQNLRRDVLSRRTVIGIKRIPLYHAKSAIKRTEATRDLIDTLIKHPNMPLGDALKKHALFGKKANMSVELVPYRPWHHELLGNSYLNQMVWQRLYSILSPDGKSIVGVLEIFSPNFEEMFKAASATKQRRIVRGSINRKKTSIPKTTL